MQEALFWFAEDIKQERRLPLPIKDEKFAPLNLHDLTFVVSHLLSEGAAMMRGQARNQVYQLTGSELMTGRVLAERMSRVLNAQVQFEAVDPKKTEEWLRRRLHNEEILREIMDTFELIARGKLGFVSQDEKKTTGREPVTVDQWLKDNANRFKPMKQ